MIKNFIKFFMLSCFIITTQLHTSAPLTKRNLERLQQGLPLDPGNFHAFSTTTPATIARTPFSKTRRCFLGIAYLRQGEYQQKLHMNQKPEVSKDIDSSEDIQTSSSQRHIPINKYRDYLQSQKQN